MQMLQSDWPSYVYYINNGALLATGLWTDSCLRKKPMLVGGVISSFIETQKLARGENKNPRAILAYRPET